jgi:hypothetical protein
MLSLQLILSGRIGRLQGRKLIDCQHFVCSGASSDVDGESRSQRSSVEFFDCAICNQNVPSTEQQPVGYVAFLQSGTGK